VELHDELELTYQQKFQLYDVFWPQRQLVRRNKFEPRWLLSRNQMPLVGRPRIRREMTGSARRRRRIQQLGPYPSLLLLVAPLAIVEPLKFLALLVAGKGHWLCGTAMIVAAYAVSLFIVERLFRLVRPKLLTLDWFATILGLIVKVRRLIGVSLGLPPGRKSPVVLRVAFPPNETPRAKG
jgi:hypothetical protein